VIQVDEHRTRQEANRERPAASTRQRCQHKDPGHEMGDPINRPDQELVGPDPYDRLVRHEQDHPHNNQLRHSQAQDSINGSGCEGHGLMRADSRPLAFSDATLRSR